MLGAGGFALVRWGVPEEPYGVRPRGGRWGYPPTRTLDLFEELDDAYWHGGG
jgi:hypothetical protein